jgi:hypothetical protein
MFKFKHEVQCQDDSLLGCDAVYLVDGYKQGTQLYGITSLKTITLIIAQELFYYKNMHVMP